MRGRVLVIGGGLAGTAAAITLARAGQPVTLFERDSEPKHKVCGEFLSGEALDLLEILGLDVAALGAVPVRKVRLCSGSQVTESTLPFAALSLTRLHLDKAMLDAAVAAGAEVRRGLAVEALDRSGPANEGWTARLSDGALCSGERVVLASGKHDLRGYSRPRGVQGNLVALKTYWRLAPAQHEALGGAVELLLHPGGYTGLQCVEGGVANLSALIDRRALAKLGGAAGFFAMLRKSCPHAEDRLRDAEPVLTKPLALSAIPYGFLRRHAIDANLWAVGDQAAVIPSFTGDGMSIALYSGVRAAESLLRQASAETFQRSLYGELRWQVARATALSVALVHAPSRRLLTGAVRLWPNLLRGSARATRLPAWHGSGVGNTG